jgi:hypothetical protein
MMSLESVDVVATCARSRRRWADPVAMSRAADAPYSRAVCQS